MSDYPMLPDGARLIDGFPDYCVTSNGDVYSRNVYGSPIRRKGPWWKMKPKRRPDDEHLYVDLFRIPKKPERNFVHCLVLEAFVGPCPENQECRHLDDNPLNNDLSNLCWGTKRENAHDAIRNGKIKVNEENKNAKYSNETILEVRALAAQKIRHKVIAAKFGLRVGYVRRIVCREIWRHL